MTFWIVSSMAVTGLADFLKKGSGYVNILSSAITKISFYRLKM
jgi:hypothetical protein